MRTALLLLLACAALPAEAIPWVTWTADPTTTLTVRVLSDGRIDALRALPEGGQPRALALRPQPVGATGWFVAEATVDGLAPGSLCVFDDGAGRELVRARTAPATLPIRFAAGGDLMHREDWLAATCAAVAKHDPAFAVIGGDWAYDNARWEEFPRWLTLLRTWRTHMRRSDGGAIPVIAAAGNHEVHRGEAGSPYERLFPEPTARAVQVGPHLAFLVLDTGHVRPIEDQAAWLAQAAAAQRARTWTFASYHVPAYPSVRDPGEWGSPSIRAAWVPVFEREGVDACFEHHDHALKRTHPLLGGRPDPAGITYLGDGAWGVGERTPRTPEQRPYLAFSAAQRHAWVVTVGAETAECEAVGADGTVLDRVTLRPRP